MSRICVLYYCVEMTRLDDLRTCTKIKHTLTRESSKVRGNFLCVHVCVLNQIYFVCGILRIVHLNWKLVLRCFDVTRWVHNGPPEPV